METTPLTILSVEDDPALACAVRLVLEADGHEVRSVENGLAAQQVLARDWPDLIILDLLLPGMDGFDLCEWISAHQPAPLCPPVLVVTALDMRAQRLVAYERGAQDYLTKPFDMHELLVKVRTWGIVSRGMQALRACEVVTLATPSALPQDIAAPPKAPTTAGRGLLASRPSTLPILRQGAQP
jgi:DNA-binding response OmpR family regulator